jgi:hypothetical protein
MSEELAPVVTTEEPAAVVQPSADTPVTEAPPEAAAPEAEVPSEPPAQENKGKERLQARFSELTARIREKEEEAAYWRERAESAPAQDEYGDNSYSPEAIQAAVQRALAEERQNAAQRDVQNAQAEKARGLQARLIESGLEGAVAIASGADIPFTAAMIDALSVSDQAAQIAHHLGTNTQEAARIAALPPQLQGYELAKLESRLASQPRTTSAPPPPPTVGTRGNPAPGLRDDLPIEDWMRLERERSRGR